MNEIAELFWQLCGLWKAIDICWCLIIDYIDLWYPNHPSPGNCEGGRLPHNPANLFFLTKNEGMLNNDIDPGMNMSQNGFFTYKLCSEMKKRRLDCSMFIPVIFIIEQLWKRSFRDTLIELYNPRHLYLLWRAFLPFPAHLCHFCIAVYITTTVNLPVCTS